MKKGVPSGFDLAESCRITMLRHWGGCGKSKGKRDLLVYRNSADNVLGKKILLGGQVIGETLWTSVSKGTAGGRHVIISNKEQV